MTNIEPCPFCGTGIDTAHGITHVRNDCPNRPHNFEERIRAAKVRVLDALEILGHDDDDITDEERERAVKALRPIREAFKKRNNRQ